MSENIFWFIYFSLLQNRTDNVFNSDESVDADWQEVLYHQKQEQYKKNIDMGNFLPGM